MKFDIVKDRKNKIKIWTELSNNFNLSFSKCIAIGNKLLGIDRKKRRLLVSPDSKNTNKCVVINLEKIKSVSIKKSYDSIKAGELTKRKFAEFLKSIHVRFEYMDANVTLFPLYEKGIDNIIDVVKLDLASNNLRLTLAELIGPCNIERTINK